MDITQIPTQELIEDRESCLNDIVACKTALAIGIERYSGGSVLDRLVGNQEIVARIEAELKRRAASAAEPEPTAAASASRAFGFRRERWKR